MVRAKFKVENIKPEHDGLQTITLRAVYSSDPNHENRQYWNATPSGEIQLGIVNQAAASQFSLGQEFYIDFTPAE